MCGFNIGCHMVDWLSGLPPWMLFAAAACIGLMVWGVAERLIRLAAHLGGWQAALGVAGILALLAAAFWPRGRALISAAKEALPGVPSPIPRKRLSIVELVAKLWR